MNASLEEVVKGAQAGALNWLGMACRTDAEMLMLASLCQRVSDAGGPLPFAGKAGDISSRLYNKGMTMERGQLKIGGIECYIDVHFVDGKMELHCRMP